MQQESFLTQILKQTDLYYEQAVSIYRHIHKYPQIGLRQYKTSDYIRNILKDIPQVQLLPPLQHQDVKSAIIASIKVQNPEKTILIRCQLDALNFIEKSGLQHCSTNDLHHACGHDGHMSTLIIAIKIIARNVQFLKKNVVFCFQPGQQGKSGAKKLLQSCPHLLKEVDQCYALHFANHNYPGHIYLSKGPITACTRQIEVQIKGKSTHCMTPNNGIDANYIGCLIINQLYSLISMHVQPFQGATMVVFQMSGGHKSAVKVSDSFHFTASLRVLTKQSYFLLINKIKSIVQNTCLSYGAQANFIQPKRFDSFDGNYRPVINDEKLVVQVKDKINTIMKDVIIQDGQRSFAGEDFCQFSQKRPSCYITVCAGLPDSVDLKTSSSKYPLHSPIHKFDEQVFRISTKIWPAIVFQ